MVKLRDRCGHLIFKENGQRFLDDACNPRICWWQRLDLIDKSAELIVLPAHGPEGGTADRLVVALMVEPQSVERIIGAGTMTRNPPGRPTLRNDVPVAGALTWSNFEP